MNPSQHINVVSGTATATAPELPLPNGNGPARRVSRGDGLV